MDIRKVKLESENILFTLEEMGVPLDEWEKLQVQIRSKLVLGNSFFFPGNTPSLKNSKRILKIYNTKSNCCGAEVIRFKANGVLKAICSKCKKGVELKKSILGPSETVVKYKDQYSHYFLKNKPRFIKELSKHSKPYLLGFYFIRDTKHIFDYGNATEILLDMMKEYAYFDDDNMNIVMDFPLGYHVDSNRPGAYIVIMNNAFFRCLTDYL
jgi:hypothetical protein